MLGTDLRCGLAEEEAVARRVSFRPNTLPAPAAGTVLEPFVTAATVTSNAMEELLDAERDRDDDAPP